LRIDLVGSHLKKVLHVGSTNETWFSKILTSVFEKLKIVATKWRQRPLGRHRGVDLAATFRPLDGGHRHQAATAPPNFFLKDFYCFYLLCM